MYKICKFCQNQFKTNRKTAIYCNQKCYTQAKIGKGNPFFGKKHSLQTKQKISLSNSGKKRTKKYKKLRSILSKGINNPFYGKHHSLETKEKISKQKKRFGKNNPFYQKKHSQKTITILSNKTSQRLANGNLNTFKIGRTGKYKEYIYHSMYELARIKQLEQDTTILRFEKNFKFKIPYKYQNRIKNYIPDIIIYKKDGSIEIEEIKGYKRLIDDIKIQAAILFLSKKNIKYRVLYKTDIFKSDYEYRKFLKEN